MKYRKKNSLLVSFYIIRLFMGKFKDRFKYDSDFNFNLLLNL